MTSFNGTHASNSPANNSSLAFKSVSAAFFRLSRRILCRSDFPTSDDDSCATAAT